MPSTVRSTASQTPPVPSKKRFRTVLGFGAVFKDAETDATAEETSNFSSLGRNLAFARKSFDAATSLKTTRRHTPGSSSISDPSFFAPKAVDIAQSQSSTVDQPTSDMQAIEVTDSRTSSRRQPVHVDQDGPWSISVAETPHNAQTYSLYIKTPTHNLTLTRTAMEIVELDQKLRDVQPGANFPPLPIDIASLPPPPKRKSTFLNTLSRLASPTSSRTSRSASGRRLNNTTNIFSSGLPTPLTSPSGEVSDPFSSFTAINGDTSPASVHTPPSAVSTSIASYLTIVSNTPSLRQARVWKRFVRVRTDDLESVRVERAIKRVRSDLAAHVGLSQAAATPLPENDADDAVLTHERTSIHEVKEGKGDGHVEVREVDGDEAKAKASSEQEEPIIDPGLLQAVSRGDENQEVQADQDQSPDVDISTSEGVEDVPHGATTSTTPEINDLPTPEAAEAIVDAATIPPSPAKDAPTSLVEEEVPATPVASDAPAGSRIHRSKSADPDNVITRLSRAFSSSASLSQDPTSSQTEDDSSLSTTGRTKRKKRSKSVDPNKEKKKKEERKSQRKVVIDDFEMLRVLGKGCAGKVLLVRHKPTSDLFALKAITKRHVLAHQELQHTLTEQAVLKRMAAESKDPFVVKLWWSFHDKENLFLVMDFHPGGDLATQLARWGRLGRDRARFYAAEIVEGVEGLHAAGVIYRDLKPENILIGSDGHIVLTDFGLSKEFPRKTAATTAPSTPSGMRGGGDFYPGLSQPATPPWMKGEKGGELAAGWPGQPVGHSDSTSTFCGTAEYLAPEVIQGLPYSYEVDWWSFGTMLYEMLTGITPFWANNHSEMYMRVLQNELQFPDDRAMDQDTKSLIRGLLQRNPGLRICEPRIKRHPYFSMIDWSHVYYKRYIPPYIPPIDPSNASDTQNFDDTFLDMEPVLDEFNENEQTDTDQEPQTDADRTDGEESNTTPSQSRSSSIPPQPSRPVVADDSVDVFDGYSFKGRHSVLLDDEESEESSEMESEEDGEVQTPATAQPQLQDVEEAPEPKTPEARPQPLPEVDLEPEPKTPATAEPPAIPTKLDAQTAAPTEVKPATPEPTLPSKDTPPPPITPDTSVPEKVKEVKVVQPNKTVATKPTTSRGHRPRREKSGVPALDKYLSDTADEDHGVTTEREDDEDDDWDFIEAADGEDRNGAKGTSLFARGVVDRYRLAVFRKASTPHRSAARSVSGTSQVSQTTDAGDSPTPSQRRGRNPGLTFRRHPRQFLRPKSPPSSFSSKTNTVARSLATSGSATLSAASTSSSAGLLTPSTSVGGSLLASPSLKSKESAMSVGDQSMTSSLSGSEAPTPDPNHDTVKALPEEPEKQKNKKLKKYKENAEKVFSIFSSPR